MRLKTLFIMFLLVVTAIPASLGSADKIDWSVKSKLQISENPVDMKLSRDGQWFYLLTGSGNLIVYSYQGEFNGKINVGQGFDRIEPGPLEDEVYLMNRSQKSIQLIEISYQRDIDISDSPFKGAADAPVVIVEYTDFQCPYCARLGSTLDQIMQLYPGKLKIVYKSFPLNGHPYAWKAATAAMAAYKKGKFWEFYRLLFENYSTLNDDKIMEIRKKFGFDTPDFDALMNSLEIRAKVAKDRDEGIRLGVQGTPTIFINGKRLRNKRLEGFKAAIDTALKN
jgi:protein-disulfide isomerase